MDIFLPKLFLKDVYEISIDLLRQQNIKGLILDVDNTLVAQYQEKPDSRLIDLINNLRNNSIKLCIVSNGSAKRVAKFNENLGLDTITKAKKPLKKGFLEAARIMDLDLCHIAVVGDQLFTDVLGGNLLNMFTILVQRIDSEEPFFVKFKRYLEKAILKLYKKS